MLEMLGIAIGGGICFLMYIGLHNAVEYGRREGIVECQRPLRASTPQGERVSLAMSEEILAGATLTFDIILWSDDHEAAVREWLDYGIFSGIGQWRNSGKGRFVWEEVDSAGKTIIES